MARTGNLSNFLTDVATAIRGKTGKSAAIEPKDFDTEISGIAPDLQEKSTSPSTSQQVIEPDSNYDGLSKVTIGAIQTEPKTVKSTTSSQTVTPSTGKFISEITVSPIDLETKNVTPSTSAQTITPSSGKDGISQVNVSAVTNAIDNNIQASNIKKNVQILRSNWNIFS